MADRIFARNHHTRLTPFNGYKHQPCRPFGQANDIVMVTLICIGYRVHFRRLDCWFQIACFWFMYVRDFLYVYLSVYLRRTGKQIFAKPFRIKPRICFDQLSHNCEHFHLLLFLLLLLSCFIAEPLKPRHSTICASELFWKIN